jgi:hypothetical protein
MNQRKRKSVKTKKDEVDSKAAEESTAQAKNLKSLRKHKKK